MSDPMNETGRLKDRIAELEAAAKHRVRRGCDVNCLKVCGGHCDCGNDELAALLEDSVK